MRPSIIEVATETFHEAFTQAMKSTLILPLAMLAVTALTVLLVKRRKRTGMPEPVGRMPEPPRAEPGPVSGQPG